MNATAPPNGQPVLRPHPAWWVGIFTGMGAWGLLSFNDAAWGAFSGLAGAALPRPWVAAAFLLVVAAHVCEAAYAYRLAVSSGRKHAALGWLVQSFFLGVPSLKLLREQVRKSEPPR